MLIAVSGNIGAGKTTLVQRLAAYFSCEAEYEAVDQNPYLEHFYQDMRRWSFPLQVYFLSHRFRQGLTLRNRKKDVILDRTIYEDAHVFAKNLHLSGYMSDTDYHTYLNLYQSMVDLVKPPELLIFLEASPEKLAGRISGRRSSGDRVYEGKIPVQYLADLNSRYHEWIAEYGHSPVIKIDINNTDLAEHENFVKLVETVQLYKNA